MHNELRLWKGMEIYGSELVVKLIWYLKWKRFQWGWDLEPSLNFKDGKLDVWFFLKDFFFFLLHSS